MKREIYKWKGYAHFDRRISIQYGKRFAENPNFVAKHGFYPFLHYVKKTRKINFDEGEVVRDFKKRNIFYCAHLDRYIYQYYAYRLNEAYNHYCDKLLLNQCSIAYRNNREGESNINFAKEAFAFIKGQHNCLIIVGDFYNFFDNIDFKYLKDCLCRVLGVDRLPDDWYNVYHNICNFSYVDISDILNEYERMGRKVTKRRLDSSEETIFEFSNIRKEPQKWIKKLKEPGEPKTYGIPQGSPISGVLANVYMIDFDKIISDFCNQHNGLYRRYSDDFIIVLPNINQKDISSKLEGFFEIVKTISKKGRLILKDEKTHSYLKDKTFDEYSLDGDKIERQAAVSFLGFSFDGNNISIRSKTLSKYYNKVNHKIERVYKLRGKIRKSDGKQIRISNKSVHNVYGRTFRLVAHNGEDRTFMTYVKRASKTFKKEEKINLIYKNRHNQIDRLINRKKHLLEDKKEK